MTKRAFYVASIQQTPVFVHWSTLAAAGAAVVGGYRWPSLALVAFAAYMVILVVHEWGHVLAARRMRCTVFAVQIYPMHGKTRYSQPWSRRDDAVIAWGGVVAQLALAVPACIALALRPALDMTVGWAALAVLGPLNIVMALLNLYPHRDLDGGRAWGLITRREPVASEEAKRAPRGWRAG